MSSSVKRALAALALLALAGCGFQPMYGAGGSDNVAVSQHLQAIKVGTIADRPGQILRNHLLDRLTPRGRPSAPAYTLDVTLAEQVTRLNILRDDTALRQQLNITASYRLLDGAGKVLTQGSLRSLKGYNKPGDQYAVLVTEQDARERALREVGDDIVNRLAAYFSKV